MLKVLKNKKGDGYIDVVIGVLVSMMLLVLTINVFSFMTMKQDLDYFAKEMIYTATSYGDTGAEVNQRYSELQVETGLSPTVTWTTTYFNSSDKTVQYGDNIQLKLTINSYFKGFGAIKIPLTLVAKQSGLSQKYWK